MGYFNYIYCKQWSFPGWKKLKNKGLWIQRIETSYYLNLRKQIVILAVMVSELKVGVVLMHGL